MALNPQRPAPAPPMVALYDNYHAGDDPRLHWYTNPDGTPRPGGRWLTDAETPTVRTQLTVHWEDPPYAIPAGQPAAWYQHVLGQVAYYHAFQRDWEPDVPGLQGADGIQYTYAIGPAPAGQPAAVLYQLTPETKVTWHAYEDNVRSLSVCMMAGRADTYDPAMAHLLGQFLDWMTAGRGDLPLLTRGPQQVVYQGQVYQTRGVYTHDETLRLQGRPVKGCCGVYAPAVVKWRAGIPL